MVSVPVYVVAIVVVVSFACGLFVAWESQRAYQRHVEHHRGRGYRPGGEPPRYPAEPPHQGSSGSRSIP